MSKQLVGRSIAALALVLFTAIAATSMAADKKEPANVLRHVVFFKFSETATPEQIKAVEDGFAALPSKITELKALHGGTDVSPEKLSKGFTHCFLCEFDSDAGRDAYLVHPAHEAFVKIAKPILADVTVIDFWAK